MRDFFHIFHLTNYTFNPFCSAPLVVAFFAVLCSHNLFHLEKKSDLNRSLAVVFLIMVLWLLGLSFMLSSVSVRISYFWAHILYLGIFFTPVSLFNVSAVLANRQKKQQILIVSVYFLSLIAFIWETYDLNAMAKYTFGFYPIKRSITTWGGPLISMGTNFILGCYILGFLNLIYQLTHTTDTREKRKIRFFLMIFLTSCLAYNDLFAGYVNVFPFGYIAILGVLGATTAFAVREHITTTEQRLHKLENEITDKAVEISQIIGELRATQLKLFETGKISAVASLSAGILHQISQPITAIHGFVKFIKKEMNKEEPFYKPICLMEEQSQYLKEMLADLMELIRHREIKKENIDVNTCINRAVNLLTDELRIRRVNWDLGLESNLPLVHADSVHLQQVFMNVVINAIQALSLLPRGDQRYIKITSESNKSKNQVILTFKDTGPGLSAADQKQIFEPFFSTKTTGTGIGLALCKDLVAEHEGTIDVLSHPGEGATFIITLPCAACVWAASS